MKIPNVGLLASTCALYAHVCIYTHTYMNTHVCIHTCYLNHIYLYNITVISPIFEVPVANCLTGCGCSLSYINQKKPLFHPIHFLSV